MKHRFSSTSTSASSAALAFTLLELLVILAILSILVGISLPIYGRIQERSRSVKDLSHLRSLASAVQACTLDYEQIIAGTGPGTWPQRVEKDYLQGWESFMSPFDTRQPTNGSQPISYAINQDLLGVDQTTIDPGAEWILLAPNIDYSGTSEEVRFSGTAASNPTVTRPGSSKPRGVWSGRKKTNIAGLDTSATTLSWEQFRELSRWVGGSTEEAPIEVEP